MTSIHGRFDSYVFKDSYSECWFWKGPLNKHGYGVFTIGTQNEYAHRFQFERHNHMLGELTVDHTCCNRDCVNPDHLEAVTRGVNVLRMWARKREAINSLNLSNDTLENIMYTLQRMSNSKLKVIPHQVERRLLLLNTSLMHYRKFSQ